MYLINGVLTGFRKDTVGVASLARLENRFFPSGHAMRLGGAARALQRAHPEASFFIWSALGFVASTRVLLLAHWLSDVLVGTGVGIAVEEIVHRLDTERQLLWEMIIQFLIAEVSPPQVSRRASAIVERYFRAVPLNVTCSGFNPNRLARTLKFQCLSIAPVYLVASVLRNELCGDFFGPIGDHPLPNPRVQ